MLATVSSKGQTVIPAAVREMAQIRAGDQFDVGFVGGMIVMRKRRPLTAEKVRALLREGRRLPEGTVRSAETVRDAIDRVRGRARG